MKIRLSAFVAFILLSFTVVSCNWFGSRSSHLSEDILGKWKIDSLAAKNDSSGLVGNLLLAIASDDLVLDFRKDSVFTFVKDTVDERAAYKVNEKEKQLTIDNKLYTVKQTGDSVLQLSQQDSTEIYLKKIPN